MKKYFFKFPTRKKSDLERWMREGWGSACICVCIWLFTDHATLINWFLYATRDKNANKMYLRFTLGWAHASTLFTPVFYSSRNNRFLDQWDIRNTRLWTNQTTGFRTNETFWRIGFGPIKDIRNIIFSTKKTFEMLSFGTIYIRNNRFWTNRHQEQYVLDQ